MGGAMTAGALVATMILTWRVLSPLQSLCAVLPRMEQVRQSIAQLNELMRLQPEREPYGTVHALRPFRGHIAFLNVSLRYGRKFDPVFMNLNLEAKPGDLITIMGLNGVGKTSIIKIAAGLYGVTTGTIRLDGIDIRQLDPVQLRRHVTYIGQSPDVFSGTVMDNLRLTAPLATETEIKAALEKAGAWEEVQAMVDGIRTEIHLNDINLSSSLIYKLNLARAYLSTASIILCDELPYAILNSKTGEEFKKFLESQKGKRTVMLVTHREDYVALADKVVVLKQDKRPIVTTPAQLFKKTNLLKGVTHGTQAKL